MCSGRSAKRWKTRHGSQVAGRQRAVQSALSAVQPGTPAIVKESWAGASARAVPPAQMEEHAQPGAATDSLTVTLTLMALLKRAVAMFTGGIGNPVASGPDTVAVWRRRVQTSL